MSWCGIEGHDAIADRFRQCVRHGRLASTFLFIGPAGVGKRTFSLRMAQAFLCERHAATDWSPCMTCDACQQVSAGSHPDVDYVCRKEGKSDLTLDLFLGDREHRMQEGLCHRISLRPTSGRRRIAIIDDADYFNAASANCLLKTLEEPPPGAILVLIGTNEQRQLPTIRSRCQILRFQPLQDDVLAEILRRESLLDPELLDDEKKLRTVVQLADGSLDKARDVSDTELIDFYSQLSRDWKGQGDQSIEIAQRIRKFVDKAGGEATPRRIRLRQIIEMKMRSLRKRLLESLEQEAQDASEAAGTPRVKDGDGPALQLDRCLEALQQIDSKANLPTLIECWVDDLCWNCKS